MKVITAGLALGVLSIFAANLEARADFVAAGRLDSLQTTPAPKCNYRFKIPIGVDGTYIEYAHILVNKITTAETDGKVIPEGGSLIATLDMNVVKSFRNQAILFKTEDRKAWLDRNAQSIAIGDSFDIVFRNSNTRGYRLLLLQNTYNNRSVVYYLDASKGFLEKDC